MKVSALVAAALAGAVGLSSTLSVVAGPFAVADAYAQDRPPPAAPPAAESAPAPPAEPAPAPEPPPAAPGFLLLQADADDLLVDLTAPNQPAQRIGLKVGDNKIELPAGTVEVAVTTKEGRAVLTRSLTIVSAATETLAIVSRAKVVIEVAADASVELDGTERDAPTKGRSELLLPPGTHGLTVQRPGFFGRKGDFTAEVGKTTTVHVELDPYDAGGKKTWGWVGLIGGGALVVSAIAIDTFSKYDDIGGDATRWTLFGLGAAGFVGGTIVLKAAMDEVAPVRPGKYDIRVARTQGGAAAMVQVTF